MIMSVMAKEMIETINKKEEGKMVNIMNLLESDTPSECEIKKVRAFVEEGKCFLDLTYKVEDSKEIWELNIPKAEVPLSCFCLKFKKGYYMRTISTPEMPSTFKPEKWIEADGSRFVLHPDKDYRYFTKKLIKKKTRKMTVSEIEKALGYSVEIVSEK